MGVLGDLLFGRRNFVTDALDVPAAAEPIARQTFAVGSDVETWNALVGGLSPARISRAEALSVPAVLRCRNLIAGTLATLPLVATNNAGERVDHALLIQPESPLGLVRSVTIAETLADLLFDGCALWLVLLRSAAGFPTAVQRICYGEWQQDPQTRVIRVNGREVDPRDVVLFTSSSPALLTAGARAIRALLRLEQTAALYADEPEPAVSWRAADGVDPDEDTVREFLAAWIAARKSRATAYIPAAFERLDGAKRMTAEELSLMDARSFAVAEIGRLFGIDSEMLSISTTSRTYLNGVEQRKSFVDFTLAPFMVALEERLSMGDVTPRGQRVRFVLDGFLRSDTLARYQAHQIGINAGFLSVAEARALEDLPEAQQ